MNEHDHNCEDWLKRKDWQEQAEYYERKCTKCGQGLRMPKQSANGTVFTYPFMNNAAGGIPK